MKPSTPVPGGILKLLPGYRLEVSVSVSKQALIELQTTLAFLILLERESSLLLLTKVIQIIANLSTQVPVATGTVLLFCVLC